jgi:hypothetical protein
VRGRKYAWERGYENALGILFGEPERQRQPGTDKSRYKESFKIDLRSERMCSTK